MREIDVTIIDGPFHERKMKIVGLPLELRCAFPSNTSLGTLVAIHGLWSTNREDYTAEYKYVRTEATDL